MGESNLVKSNQPCGDCGSSDALAYYDDGHSYCFSCGKTRQHGDSHFSSNESKVSKGWSDKSRKMKTKTLEDSTDEDVDFNKSILKGYFKSLKNRNLSEDTCKKYGVEYIEKGSHGTPAHTFPLYHRKTGNLICQKVRTMTEDRKKDIFITKKYESAMHHIGLFGQQAFPPGSAKAITITTGEYDAMSIYEMTGNMYPCVSIPNGDQSALRSIKENWEYLNTFESIVLCFDNDVSGKKALDQVVNEFKSSKFKILEIPKNIDGVEQDLKDANDYHKLGNSKDFVKLWYKAKVYTP